ncbi:DUF6668 family protein [Nocardioides sp. Bht2]|uniref:DUF6668 family protein n=1 Tax=Nocardioides sp. Bht2 TaxID=3392297 RepID=UPI0039B36A92
MRRGDPAEEPQSPWAVAGIGAPSEPVIAPAPVDTASVVAPVHAPRGAVSGLPRVKTIPASTAPLVWVAAHGGAGATSLARGSGIGLDLTRCWPDPHLGWPREVAIVCRGNAAGVEAAAELLAEAASGAVPDLRIVALVVVADCPGKATRHVRSRLRELGGAVGAVVHLDWISDWRDAPYTSQKSATKVATKVLKQIG